MRLPSTVLLSELTQNRKIDISSTLEYNVDQLRSNLTSLIDRQIKDTKDHNYDINNINYTPYRKFIDTD